MGELSLDGHDQTGHVRKIDKWMQTYKIKI